MVYGSSPDRSAPIAARTVLDMRHLSEGELASLGVSEMAYVKPVEVEGGMAFAIHAADGTPMALATDAEVAFAAIREHGLEPTLVH